MGDWSCLIGGFLWVERKTDRVTNVKIASDLAHKAKTISQDKGISMAEYVTELLNSRSRGTG